MCPRESGLWVVCAIVILAICDVDSLGVVHLDYFFVSFLCSLEGGHLFSSLSLKFLAINSCFVGIIVRNFDMVSRFDPRTVLVLEDIVLACFRGDSRLRCGKFSTIALQLVFRGGDRFRGAI